MRQERATRGRRDERARGEGAAATTDASDLHVSRLLAPTTWLTICKPLRKLMHAMPAVPSVAVHKVIAIEQHWPRSRSQYVVEMFAQIT